MVEGMVEDGLTAVPDNALLDEVRLLAALIPNGPGKHFDTLLQTALSNKHEEGKYASKYTHFALLLTYRGDHPRLVVERTRGAVLVKREDSTFEPFKRGQRVPLYSSLHEQFIEVDIMSEIAEYTHAKVTRFVFEERRKPFRSCTKNCKHLAFDFWKTISPPAGPETNLLYRMFGLKEQTAFEKFCKKAEEVFRKKHFSDEEEEDEEI